MLGFDRKRTPPATKKKTNFDKVFYKIPKRNSCKTFHSKTYVIYLLGFVYNILSKVADYC